MNTGILFIITLFLIIIFNIRPTIFLYTANFCQITAITSVHDFDIWYALYMYVFSKVLHAWVTNCWACIVYTWMSYQSVYVCCWHIIDHNPVIMDVLALSAFVSKNG